jgi:hypothetical protein
MSPIKAFCVFAVSLSDMLDVVGFDIKGCAAYGAYPGEVLSCSINNFEVGEK